MAFLICYFCQLKCLLLIEVLTTLDRELVLLLPQTQRQVFVHVMSLLQADLARVCDTLEYVCILHCGGLESLRLSCRVLRRRPCLDGIRCGGGCDHRWPVRHFVDQGKLAYWTKTAVLGHICLIEWNPLVLSCQACWWPRPRRSPIEPGLLFVVIIRVHQLPKTVTPFQFLHRQVKHFVVGDFAFDGLG